MELTIREEMKRDTIIGLDINLQQLMKIIEPVNYTGELSRWKADKDWLQSNGITKMISKLREILLGVEFLRDY